MRKPEDESAQFMLLAGFIIGIGLVVTTIMLNSIVFESNMAVGAGTDSIRSEIINLMQITKDETRRAYGNATIISSTRSTQINNFNNQTGSFKMNLSKIYAFHGEGINISWDVTNWNNSNNAYFTDNGTSDGMTNWIVVENVNKSNITVNFTSASPTLQIELKINDSNINWINLTTNGTFSNSSAIPYSIIFHNGNVNQGNYSITGKTFNGRNFTRGRDYVLNSTLVLSTPRVRVNITIPVTVPW